MYIERVPNRNSPPAILLRESFREGARVRKRTIANLSHWPAEQIDALRLVLRGKLVAPVAIEAAFETIRNQPHGHVAAVLGTLRALGIEKLLSPRQSRERDLVVAMIVARIISPSSKLAAARGLDQETLSSSLGDVLGVGDAKVEELYAAMDWLLKRQNSLEAEFAKRHLQDDVFALYDLTSTYFEGRSCPLGKLGYSRDGKKNKPQIVFGLLCDGDGRPVAVEVFEGNTGDPKTVPSQINKMRERFQMKDIVIIGDRGMLTQARIREDLAPHEGIAWISALRGPAIRELVKTGSLQLSLFDDTHLAEIASPDFPNERLVVCRNPQLATERARKRRELLAATERELEKIAAATKRKRNPIRTKEAIGIRVGKVINRFKMAKHFETTIKDESFSYKRNDAKIAEEQALDGFYVVRSSVPDEAMDAEQLVDAYKSLSKVERAFRSFKTVDLKVRPIYHRLEDRVRAHVFLCMLAYYVEWHMRQRLAPILFDDDDKENAARRRQSPVEPAKRSTKAESKALTKRSDDDYPVHSFQTLLNDLATLNKNRIRVGFGDEQEFDQFTTPTPLQQRAFDLLGVSCRL